MTAREHKPLELTVQVETQDGLFTSVTSGSGVSKGLQVMSCDSVSRSLNSLDPTDQNGVDKLVCTLDGSADLSEFGRELVLGISIATAKAGAAAMKSDLVSYLARNTEQNQIGAPVPMMPIFKCSNHSAMSVIPFDAINYHDAMNQLEKLMKKLPLEQPKNEVEMMDCLSREISNSGSLVCLIGENSKFESIINENVLAWVSPLKVYNSESWIELNKKTQHVQLFGELSLDLLENVPLAHLESGFAFRLNNYGTLTQALHAVKLAKENSMEQMFINDNCLDNEFVAGLCVSQCFHVIYLEETSPDLVAQFTKIEKSF